MNTTLSRHPGPGVLPETLRDGRLVLCEEVARDGAQAKTLLLGPQRVDLFRRTAEVMGEYADECLVSMVGFPAIGPGEVDCVRQCLEALDVGYQQVVCRTIERDLLQCIELMRDAHAGRVLFVVPASRPLASAMLHATPEEALEEAVRLLRLGLEEAAGEVSIDVCLADIGRAEPDAVADAANRLTREGAEVIMMADTIGRLHPLGHRDRLTRITRRLEPEVCVHAHFHNDLGLALGLNLQALELGHRMFGTSWLGLGERSGLGNTEELLGVLATATDGQLEDLGTDRDRLGISGWRPERIVETARAAASVLDMPRRVTDPFVGTGVNSISTGTPFVAPDAFQPYDAEGVLDVPRRVELTHLASTRVVEEVARGLGVKLSREAAATIRDMIKAEAYASGSARFDLERVLLRAEAKAQSTQDSQQARPDHWVEQELQAQESKPANQARRVLQAQPCKRPEAMGSRQARA
jgi:2-isopropylmalate synthase